MRQTPPRMGPAANARSRPTAPLSTAAASGRTRRPTSRAEWEPDFGTLAAQGVSDVLPAGDHSFTVECRQNEADIRFQTQLSAVALGPG